VSHPTAGARCGNMSAMCGCYASFLLPEAVARFFRTMNALPNIGPSWNVAPGQQAMLIRRLPETGERHLDLLQWGLLPDPERFFRRGRVAREIAQNSVITLRQAELAHQAFSGTPTRNISDRPREVSNTACFPGAACEDLIWLINKCFPLTQSVATSPSGHADLKLDGRALDG